MNKQQQDLEFTIGEWEPFSDEGAFLKCVMKKKTGRYTRQVSVIIWRIINPDFEGQECYQKFFIIEPERSKSIFDYTRDGPLFDTLEEAKPHAKQLLDSYLNKIKNNEINWWTKKEIRE